MLYFSYGTDAIDIKLVLFLFTLFSVCSLRDFNKFTQLNSIITYYNIRWIFFFALFIE